MLYAVGCWLVFTLSLAACSHTKTILVPTGDPVRIRQTVKGAAVWVPDANGKWIEGTMDLPVGWYCLPDDTEVKP